MPNSWQVKVKDKIHGPFSDAQLHQLAGSGRIKQDTAVRSDANTLWVAAGSVPGLFTVQPERSQPESATEPHETAVELPVAPVIVPLTLNRAEYQRSNSRLLSRSPNSLLDILLDWRFEKYLTPLIVRATWLGAVAAAGSILCLVIADSVYAVVLNRELVKDLVALEGNPQPQNQQQFGFNLAQLGETRLYGAARGISVALVIVSSLLSLRVVLEFCIVVFNIATSLQRIEQVADSQSSPIK